jgi:hypothetical protein
MDLTLSVPEYDPGLMVVVETKPAKVEQWLAALPILNLAETSHRIFESLHALNRMELDDKTRQRLMEIYREPVARICTKLKDEYVGLPLPLPEKARLAAKRTREFQLELAYGYKRVLINAVTDMSSRPSSRAMNSMALVIQRAIRYLAEALVRSYQCYHSAPENIWREIHELYSLAEAFGAVNVPVPDDQNNAIPESTVSHVYKQALLVDLADPYHLPVRMVGLIQHYLNRWASLARLGPATARPGKNCQFLIDLHNDRAGELYFPSEASITAPQQYRLLDTIELARVIHGQLGMLQRGDKPAPDGLHADFFDTDNVQDLLKRMLSSWGVNPKRMFTRTPKGGAAINVAIGIRAISHWLNNGERFLLSSEFVGPMPQARFRVGGKYVQVARDADAEPVAPPRPNSENPELAFENWGLVDESAGGMAISKPQVANQRARIGDLVAVRADDSDFWELNSIRWIKNPDNTTIEIGMKRISPVAQAVMVKYIDENRNESDFQPAILVPPLATLKQRTGLLTFKGVFRPERQIHYDDGYRLVKIKPTRLVESTQLYEHFEFVEVS